MEAIMQYCIQFSIAITMFYGLYLLILKNETIYQANRFYLVSGLLLAILLPLFPISYITPISLVNNADFFSLSENQLSGYASTTNVDASGSSWTFIDALILIYALGIIISLSRLLWQIFRVLREIKNNKYIIIEGIRIIDQSDVMPYSFFNVVFIDIQKYSERELSNIIAHEKVHIQQRHWIDLLIIELLSVLFWINPVVWLYERSIKQNHEYLADQGVLLAGYSPGQYQVLLINQLMGVKVLGFAHNLNFALNKKRMKMMKKEKSSRISKMKLLLAIPIIAFLVLAFAKKEYVMIKASERAPILQENLDENPESNVVSQEDMIKVHGTVWTEDKVALKGANIILQNTTIGIISDQYGKFEIEVPNKSKLIVSYIGYETNAANVRFSKTDEGWIIFKMKKGVFNIQLPEVTKEQEVVDAPLHPAPPKKKEESEVWTIVEDMPHYKKGGMQELSWDIYKEAASIMKKTNDRGEVIVGFTVNEEGKVINPHIVEGANSKMLDASAIKIVQKLDNWNPGVQRDKKVPVDLTVPVRFE